MSRRLLPLLTALLPLTALADVQPESGLGLPRDASEHGHRIDQLINSAHVLHVILFVIMVVWMVWASIAHSARARHKARYDHGNSKRDITVVLGLTAFVFFIVDGHLFVNTVIDLDEVFWNFSDVAKNPKTLRIEVNAHQWSWDLRYAGSDGQFGTDDDVVRWNDLKIPVDRPIYVQLTSTDVIHALYLPNFRTKMDAVPGQVNRLWFTAKETGEFEIGCAQHCGTHHYKMRGVVEVLSEDQFDAWLTEASINAKRSYDAEDTGAHWGWAWKEY